MKTVETVRNTDEASERKDMGERLRQAREYLGLSQEEVARYLGVPRTAVCGIESGQRKVEATELKRLAAVYRQSVSYLAGEDEESASLPADVLHMARAASKLSQSDRKELGRFAEYLQTRATGSGR